MKRYVETMWLFFTFDEESNVDTDTKDNPELVLTRYSWHIKSSSVEEAMTELATFCDTNAYEVKGIIPITRAQAFSMVTTQRGRMAQGGYGLGAGFGWGIGMIVGFIAIVQRVEDLDELTFNKRVEARALKKQKEELTRTINDVRREIKELELALTNIETIIAQGIVEITKGSLRKKRIYKVGAKEFEDKFRAEAYMRDLEKQREDKRSKISSLNERVQQLNDEVANIEAQIMSLEA